MGRILSARGPHLSGEYGQEDVGAGCPVATAALRDRPPEGPGTTTACRPNPPRVFLNNQRAKNGYPLKYFINSYRYQIFYKMRQSVGRKRPKNVTWWDEKTVRSSGFRVRE